MSWHSAAEFFAMGGYGLYVWGAYGVTAACMALEPVRASARLRQARRELATSGPVGTP